MSNYVLVNNEHKSSINEMSISPLKIVPPVTNQTNHAGWMLETDAKNVTNPEWQITIFVTMEVKCMEGSACVQSMTII